MITHKWINTLGLTPSVTSYYDFFRKLVKHCPVEILRNEFNAQDGITIVGDSIMVSATVDVINRIIKQIEVKVNRKKFKTDFMLGHIHEQRASYKSKLINRCIEDKELWESIDAVYQTYLKKYNNEAELKNARLEYISTTSLNTLKRFYGK